MIGPDMGEKVLSSSVCECQIKLSLISDYIERFKIQDVRILAPIHDIERCVDMMAHALHENGDKK
jgi:hypothetical protein